MSQMAFLNADEMRALQGMTLEAKALYVFEFRRYADANGVTGRARRHSYQSLREQLTVVPDWGSKQSRQPEITEGKIRAVIAELERHGLLERAGTGLVFSLPLATQHKSVQKRNDGGTTAIATDRTTAGTTAQTPTAATVAEEGTTGGTTGGTTDENAEEQRTSPITNIYTSAASTRARQNPHLFQPDGRERFGQFIGWKPSDTFLTDRRSYGFKPESLTDSVVAEFSGFWAAKGDELTQAEWEHRLARQLVNLSARTAAMPIAPRRQPTPENFKTKDYSAGINADGSF